MKADTPAQRYLLERTGFEGHGIVVLMRLDDQLASSDPYAWPALTGRTRTMHIARVWIQQHFDQVADCGVVDVEFILRLRPAAKHSQPETEPPG